LISSLGLEWDDGGGDVLDVSTNVLVSVFPLLKRAYDSLNTIAEATNDDYVHDFLQNEPLIGPDYTKTPEYSLEHPDSLFARHKRDVGAITKRV